MRRLWRWLAACFRRVEPVFDEAALAGCVNLHHLVRRLRELERIAPAPERTPWIFLP